MIDVPVPLLLRKDGSIDYDVPLRIFRPLFGSRFFRMTELEIILNLATDQLLSVFQTALSTHRTGIETRLVNMAAFLREQQHMTGADAAAAATFCVPQLEKEIERDKAAISCLQTAIATLSRDVDIWIPRPLLIRTIIPAAKSVFNTSGLYCRYLDHLLTIAH